MIKPGLYRNIEPDEDVNHEPVMVVDATWREDGDGGWYVDSEEWAISAHAHARNVLHDLGPDRTVVVCSPAEPTINCGGKMIRFVNLLPLERFEACFVPVQAA